MSRTDAGAGTLVHFTTGLLHASTEEEIVRALFEIASELFGMVLAAIVWSDVGGGTHRVTGICHSGRLEEELGDAISALIAAFLLQPGREHAPVVGSFYFLDINHEDVHFPTTLRNRGIDLIRVFAIANDRTNHPTIVLGAPASVNLSLHQESLLTSVVAQAELALEKVSANAEASNSPWRAQALCEAIRAISSESALEHVLNAVVRHTRDLFEADIALLTLLDEDSNVHLTRASAGVITDAYKQSMAKIDEGIGGLALSLGQPVHTSDYFDDTRFSHPMDPVIKREGIQSILCAPLLVGEIAIGVLYVANRRLAHYPFDQASLLASLASVVAIAIQKAQLKERDRQALAELRELYALTDRQNEALKRSIAIHSQLDQIVVDDEGVDSIGCALAGFLSRPVILEDQFYNVVCCATGELDRTVHQFRDSMGPVALGELRAIPELGKEIDTLLEKRGLVHLPGFPGQEGASPRVVVPIVVGDDVLGYLSVLEGERTFDDRDFTAIEQAAMVFALELAKQKAAVQLSLRLKHDFLGTLLNGTWASDKLLLDKASYFGCDLSQPHRVLVIEIEAQKFSAGGGAADLQKRAHSIVGRVLSQHSPKSMVIPRGETVIVLAATERHESQASSKKATSALAEHIRADLQRWLPASVISIGVGRECQSPIDYSLSYEQARKALTITKAFQQASQVVFFQDLRSYRFLYEVGDMGKLEHFANEILGALLRYDRQRGTSLVRTLDAFFQNNRSLTKTAESLFVHVNTLRYRLQRIEAVAGLNLDDPETCLSLQLALRIRQILA